MHGHMWVLKCMCVNVRHGQRRWTLMHADGVTWNPLRNFVHKVQNIIKKKVLEFGENILVLSIFFLR